VAWLLPLLAARNYLDRQRSTLARPLLDGVTMRRHPWLSLLGFVAACSSAQSEPVPEATQIDEYIHALPYLGVDAAKVSEGDRSAPKSEGDYSCTTQNLTETRQYDRVVAYAANSDSLYPGALVSADSVVTGLFTQIALPRAPSTISVSLENLAGSKQATVADSSLSGYRDALTKILDAQVTGSTPANIYSEIEQVHTENQLNMALGVEASWGLGIASLKTSFNFNDQKTRSRYVVRYTQAYYTVDLDAPQSPSAVFAPNVALADIEGKIDAQHPPVYVSSVTYGRMVVFTFESQYSAEEMAAALNFAYSGGVDVKGDVSVTYKDIISQSNITAFILGGDGGTAAQTIDSYEALINFIKTGGNYSKTSPGAPIAYKLSYLKDNSPARMSFTTDYDVKDCVRVSQRVRVTLKSIAVDKASDEVGGGGDLEVFGLVTAQGTSSQTLFNLPENQYVTIKEGQSFTGANGMPIAETVIDVSPHNGAAIKLRAALKDADSLSGADLLGDVTLGNPFETGWRKQTSITLTGSDTIVRLNFELAPI